MKNFIFIMGGTVLAQLLAIAISPILSRIYTPDDFGSFALVVSFTYLLSSVICLRLDFAILSADNNAEKTSIKIASIKMLIVNIAVLLVLSLLTYSLSIIKIEQLYTFLLVLILVIVSSLYNIYFNLALSEKSQRSNFVGKTLQGGGGALSQLGLGLISKSYLGLIFGQFIGLALSTIYLYKKIDTSLVGAKSFSLRKYRKYMIDDNLNNFFIVLSNQIPLLTIIYFYGKDFGGSFYMANRILILPIAIISASLSQFISSRYISWKRNNALKENLKEIFIFLIYLVGLPVFCLSLVSEKLFLFLLGDQWQIATTIIWISLLWIAPKFIFDSFLTVLSLDDLQRESAIFQFITNIIRFAVIAICFNLNVDGIKMITYFSISISLMYMLALIYFMKEYEIFDMTIYKHVLLLTVLYLIYRILNLEEIYIYSSIIFIAIYWAVLIYKNYYRLLIAFKSYEL